MCWTRGSLTKAHMASPVGPLLAEGECTGEDWLFFFFLAWHVGSYFPSQGLNQRTLLWMCGVLTTGPPGKFPDQLFCAL